MARHPPEQIRQLQQSISMERLVADDGVELHEGDGVLTGRCPRHPDQGTFQVDPVNNTWSCLNCELEHGGPVEWVMTHRRVSRSRALDILLSGVGVQDEIQWPDGDTGHLEVVTDYYHRRLLQSEEGLGYLECRGLRDDGLIRHLRLGLADRTLGYRLPSRNSTAGAELRARLQALGVLRSSGHEHLAGSLVVPVIGGAGVADLYGRKVSGKLRGGTRKHLFLRDSPPGPWFLDPGAEGDEVVVTASVMDALTWWAVGMRRVLVTPMMTLGEPHVGGLLEGRGVSRVVFAYRRTAEAQEVIETAAPAITERGMSVYRIVFPEGVDANDIHVRGGDLQGIVRNAEWVASPSSTPSSPPPESEPAPDDNYPEPGVNGDEVVLNIGDRRWRVRGLLSNNTPETMRVNVMVSNDETLHVDTLDLYSHRHRVGFAKEAGSELGVPEKVIKGEMGTLIFLLEDLQDKAFAARQDPKNEPVRLTPKEESEALDLLRDAALMDRVADDLENAGLVGENTNKMVAYLAATSRLLDEPLGVLIQSPSASGKTSLMDTVLSFIPPESQVSYSAMTGQSLFYMSNDALKNKVLGVAEEQGATRAAYPLKLLQSEGKLTIASTDKEPGSGRLQTRMYHVQGPVALMITTSGIDVDEELSNRCITLSVDDNRDQTRAIHARQRIAHTLEGIMARKRRDEAIKRHRNAQRMLRPVLVMNPYAETLTFPDHAPRTRRDHAKYLTLIRTIALLHQYQREVRAFEQDGQRVEYIEVIPSDIEIANRLAHEALGRSLDELTPHTRTVLERLHHMVVEDCELHGVARRDYRFTRRHARERLRVGNTQLRIHLARLVDLEYLIAHRASGVISYELVWDGGGTDGKPFLSGLVDVGTTAKVRGSEADLPGSMRVKDGGNSAACRSGAGDQSSINSAGNGDGRSGPSEKVYPPRKKGTS